MAMSDVDKAMESLRQMLSGSSAADGHSEGDCFGECGETPDENVAVMEALVPLTMLLDLAIATEDAQTYQQIVECARSTARALFQVASR